VSISPKEACAGTMDGAYTWREGERVNGASSRSLKRSGKRLSQTASQGVECGNDTVERARGQNSAFVSQGRKLSGLRSLGSEAGFHDRFRVIVGFRFRESVKMVHRPYSEATIERERLGRSWQRQNKLATSGCGRSASSALKRRPVSGAPGKSLAEAGAGEQRRFSLSFYLAKGWRRIE
jgi:hypothetical protein